MSRVRPSSGPRSRPPTPSPARAPWSCRRPRCGGRPSRAASIAPRRRPGTGRPRCGAGGRRGRRRSPAGRCPGRRASVTVTTSWPCRSRRQQLRGEVQARGRRRRRAGMARVDGLVALGIGRLLVDVRRQRHLAGALERLPIRDVPADGPGTHAAPGRPSSSRVSDLDRELAGGQRLARPQTAGGPGQRLPAAVGLRLEQEHLDRAAASRAGRACAPGRTRVSFSTTRSSGRSWSGQVAEVPVPDRRPSRGRTPAAGRCRAARPASGRSARGKVVVEVFGAHRSV